VQVTKAQKKECEGALKSNGVQESGGASRHAPANWNCWSIRTWRCRQFLRPLVGRCQRRAEWAHSHSLSKVHSKNMARRQALTCFTPFFTDEERKQAACQHRLFFAQVEFCDNLIFRRRVALDQLGERLLDANRTIGQPNKITVIFGRKITPRYRGKLQTVIEDLDLPNPVIRSHYGQGFIKQYVRNHLLLRTESATNNVAD